MLFGHSQQVWTCFGHLLDIFLTIDIFWSLFWTLLVFLRPKCVRPLIVLEHPNITMASPSRVAAATCIEIPGHRGASKEAASQPDAPSASASAYTCCSLEDPDEFQVDLCPRKWFCCCSNKGAAESGGRQRMLPVFLQIVWRICFVILCLPLCYPCYLSR